MYCSADTAIFQANPVDWKPSLYPLESWTDTLVGYCRQANHLAWCISLNRELRGRDYTWAVSLNIEEELAPRAIRSLWVKVCRKLHAQGIVALWVREPSLSNHCNYHLLVASTYTQGEVKQAIQRAMPAELPYHCQVDPVKNQVMYLRYILKARTTGKPEWEKKRLLFKGKIGMTKYGTIGKFWTKPRAELWEMVKEKEQLAVIAEGLSRPGVKKFARRIYDLLAGAVSLKEIQRSYGYFADQLQADGWLQDDDDDELEGVLVLDADQLKAIDDECKAMMQSKA